MYNTSAMGLLKCAEMLAQTFRTVESPRQVNLTRSKKKRPNLSRSAPPREAFGGAAFGQYQRLGDSVFKILIHELCR
jgi:hypothetical protein